MYQSIFVIDYVLTGNKDEAMIRLQGAQFSKPRRMSGWSFIGSA
jgi:hypothetical protein